MRRVPAYFDAFLEAIAQGQRVDHVHLGYWDEGDGVEPARARATFERAQRRLSERLVAMLDLRSGDRLLDVGCGFGGTLRLVGGRHRGVVLHGINIDARQLAAASRCGGGAEVHWTVADACQLPFAATSFDHLLCVEAAFHFSSRRAFFEEAHRVLRRGGRLAMSDIILAEPSPPDLAAALADRLEADFGPWPDKWVGLGAIERAAAEVGFTLEVTDATAGTWPSYHTIAPARRTAPTGAVALRELHRRDCLRYLHLCLERL